MRIVVRAGALALACLGAAAGPVLAQTYPTKPITMIVPYPPGGATDVIGRVLGQQLSINLGAPVVIENRTGAAGNIGAQAAAQAKPDGYTLLMGALTSHSINAVLQPGVVKYNLQKDFAPVSIVGVVPLVLVVTPSVPAQTVQGFIDLARAKPGDISFASAGNGSPQHLAGELFKLVTRTDMLHVPYKGSGPALVDLIGGQVQSMIETVPAAMPQIKAGKLRPLMVAARERVPTLPDVPSAAEAGLPLPKEPVIFNKVTTCICGPNDDTMIPKDSSKLDWEVELGIVIGRPAKYVSQDQALSHVAGYCVVNDVSERTFQIERGGQWDKGKGCDTFGPLGPYLVTKDEVSDVQNLRLWLEVGGKRYQDGNTSNMIFGVAELVSYVSRFMSLHPGDVISTGTPAGVGLGQKPEPVYLRPGQMMRLGIDGLGEQTQRTVADG